MNKNFIPFCVAKSIYHLPIAFYLKHQIKNVFVDLDNTLDAFNALEPTVEALNLIENFKSAKINVIIVSNNKKRRVAPYAEKLNVPFLYSLRKPLLYKMKRFLKKENIKIAESILIGDQLITDILFANRLKMKNVLVEKIVEVDQWTTKINRLLDKKRYKKLKEEKLLISWEEK